MNTAENLTRVVSPIRKSGPMAIGDKARHYPIPSPSAHFVLSSRSAKTAFFSYPAALRHISALLGPGSPAFREIRFGMEALAGCSVGGRSLLRFPSSGSKRCSPPRHGRSSFYPAVRASREGDGPELDKWDQMELKFGRLLGEDPKLTLAKVRPSS